MRGLLASPMPRLKMHAGEPGGDSAKLHVPGTSAGECRFLAGKDAYTGYE